MYTSKFTRYMHYNKLYWKSTASQIEKDTYEPVTIAAHHDSDEWSEDELKEIEDIKKYAKSKKK